MEDKFAIWLVWDIDLVEIEQSLRAVTSTKERAERYKVVIERQHKFYNNEKKFNVDIEKREANHLMGYNSLKRMGEN